MENVTEAMSIIEEMEKLILMWDQTIGIISGIMVPSVSFELVRGPISFVITFTERYDESYTSLEQRRHLVCSIVRLIDVF